MFDSGNNVNIAKGAILSVNSSENDWDHRKNVVKTFDNVGDAKNFIECVAVYADVFGNVYEPRDRHDKEFLTAVRNLSEDNLRYLDARYETDTIKILNLADGEDYEKVVQDIRELLSEMSYDVMGGSEGYACRCLDDWYVYEVNAPIIVNVVHHS